MFLFNITGITFLYINFYVIFKLVFGKSEKNFK